MVGVDTKAAEVFFQHSTIPVFHHSKQLVFVALIGF